MANSELLTKLLEDKDTWNQWKLLYDKKKRDKLFQKISPTDDDDEIIGYTDDEFIDVDNLLGHNFSKEEISSLYSIDLSNANLQGLDLDGINLSSVNLYGANLHSVNMKEANLEGACLIDADLSNGNFKDALFELTLLKSANFQEANFENVDFQGADMRDINAWYANFQNANLTGIRCEDFYLGYANLEGAIFEEVNLSKIDFNHTNLSNTNLKKVNLQGLDFKDNVLVGANLYGADLHLTNITDIELTNVNLVNAKGIQFDGNHIEGVKISRRTQAPWLTLKRQYSSTMLLFHLLAVIAFFFPYVINIISWRGINLAQQLSLEAQNTIILLEATLVEEEHELASVAESLSSNIKNTTICFYESCKKWHIGQLLLGLHRGWAWGWEWYWRWSYASISIVIIIYNIMRLGLTQHVGVLKDEERTTLFTPAWDDYKIAYRIHHYFLKYMLYIAVIFGLLHASTWLFDVVELPNKIGF